MNFCKSSQNELLVKFCLLARFASCIIYFAPGAAAHAAGHICLGSRLCASVASIIVSCRRACYCAASTAASTATTATTASAATAASASAAATAARYTGNSRGKAHKRLDLLEFARAQVSAAARSATSDARICFCVKRCVPGAAPDVAVLLLELSIRLCARSCAVRIGA